VTLTIKELKNSVWRQYLNNFFQRDYDKKQDLRHVLRISPLL